MRRTAEKPVGPIPGETIHDDGPAPHARRGGETVKERYGRDFYVAIGRKGGRATRERHGSEFYNAIGRKGGQTTSETHGSGFFRQIGRKGGSRVRELIRLGKEAGAGGAG